MSVEQVHDHDGNLLLSSNWREGVGTSLPYVNAMDAGVAGDGTTDDTAAIQAAIDALNPGERIHFPAGSYKITDAITVLKPITITGELPGLGGNGTWFYRSADAAGFVVGPEDPVDRFNGVVLKNFAITGQTTFTTDAMLLRYMGNMWVEGITINASGGNGLKIKEVWDSRFFNVFLRNCGKHSTEQSALWIDGPEDDNANNLYFTGCDFEHDTYGPLITVTAPLSGASPGDSTNSITFTSCKFEPSGRPSDDRTPVSLNRCSTFAFTNCFFSIYARTGGGGYFAEILDGSRSIAFTECLCYNNDQPTGFALVDDSKNVTARLRGYLCGGLTQTGTTRGVSVNVWDDEVPILEQGGSLLDFPPIVAIDVQKLATSAHAITEDALAPRGRALQKAGAAASSAITFTKTIGGINSRGIMVRVRGRLADGSAGGGAWLLSVTRSGRTLPLLTFAFTDEYKDFKAIIPAAYVDANSRFQISSDTSTDVALIAEIAWAPDMYWGEPPLTVNGIAGDYWLSRGITFEVGEVIRISTGFLQTGRGIEGWAIAAAGTTNGIPLAIDADTTNGSKSVTVDSVIDLYVGAYVSIAGAVTKAKIVSISGTTVVLDTAASATVSAAAMDFVEPTVVEFGITNQRLNTYTLPYNASNTQIDFAKQEVQTVTLAGDIVFSNAAMVAGRSVRVRIIGDGSTRNFTFPSWKWLGTAPIFILANKTALLTLTAYGENTTDVLASYQVEA